MCRPAWAVARHIGGRPAEYACATTAVFVSAEPPASDLDFKPDSRSGSEMRDMALRDCLCIAAQGQVVAVQIIVCLCYTTPMGEACVESALLTCRIGPLYWTTPEHIVNDRHLCLSRLVKHVLQLGLQVSYADGNVFSYGR